jgi:hypothetical protein
MPLPTRFRRFRDFYPYYLAEHRDPTCRRLHVAGTFLVLLAAGAAALTGSWRLLLVMPVAGYGFAWIGHFVFEKNRPATFRHPWYSLLGDLALFRDVLLGRIPFTVMLALLLSGVADDAGAQRAEILLGAGPTFSGRHLSTETPQLMGAGLVRLTPNVGVRADILYTVDEEEDLVGVNLDGVLSPGAAGSRLRPYLLGGAGVFFAGGDAQAAVNGGIGLRLRASRTVGLFLEGRYFRFFRGEEFYNDMIFVTAGLSFALP